MSRKRNTAEAQATDVVPLKQSARKWSSSRNARQLASDMAAVRWNGMALQYVITQTPELCMVAVKQNGWALAHVKEKTPELCMEAVKQTGRALLYVKTQTPELCMEAVKQNGWALEYVKTQTPEMCMAAVMQNGSALEYVQTQTPELSIASQQTIASDNCRKHQEMITALETRVCRDVALVIIQFEKKEEFYA